MEFVEYLFSIVPPRFKKGVWERRLITTTGEILNLACDGAAYAVRSRFLTDAPTDALPAAGNDRLLVRGPNEPDASWRARLLGAWDAWALAGSVHPDGLLGQLEAFGYTSSTDAPEFLESQDVGAPLRSDYPSRFWLVVPPTCHSYTTAIPDEDAEAIRRMVRQFRPGNVICGGVVFVVAGYLWDWRMPDTWDDWYATTDTWDEANTFALTIAGF